jgi:hypothetical protein
VGTSIFPGNEAAFYTTHMAQKVIVLLKNITPISNSI